MNNVFQKYVINLASEGIPAISPETFLNCCKKLFLLNRLPVSPNFTKQA